MESGEGANPSRTPRRGMRGAVTTVRLGWARFCWRHAGKTGKIKSPPSVKSHNQQLKVFDITSEFQRNECGPEVSFCAEGLVLHEPSPISCEIIVNNEDKSPFAPRRDEN